MKFAPLTLALALSLPTMPAIAAHADGNGGSDPAVAALADSATGSEPGIAALAESTSGRATAIVAAVADSTGGSEIVRSGEVEESGAATRLGSYGELHFTEVDGRAGGGEVDLTRLVLSVEHRFDRHFRFYAGIEMEHANAKTEIEQAWVEYFARPAFAVRAGVILVPVGILNLEHEPGEFHGVNRPEVDDVIIPTTWREAGVSISGAPFSRVHWQIAFVDGLLGSRFTGIGGIRDGRQEASEAKANDFAIAARLDVVPIRGVEVGASAYTGKSGSRVPTLDHSRVTLGEADVCARWDFFVFRGELAHGEIEDARALALTNATDPIGGAIEGWYGEVSADLMQPVRDLGGSVGRVELWPFFRLEHTSTQLDMPAGVAANRFEDRLNKLVGLSLKPIPQIVLKADYEWINARTGPLAQRWHVGAGYSF